MKPKQVNLEVIAAIEATAEKYHTLEADVQRSTDTTIFQKIETTPKQDWKYYLEYYTQLKASKVFRTFKEEFGDDLIE